MHGNGRRLSPQEIAERFGAQRREHDAQQKRRLDYKARRQTQEEAARFLANQDSPTISTGFDALRDLRGMRDPKGKFMGVKGS